MDMLEKLAEMGFDADEQREVLAMFAEERAALVELQHIDAVLARRPALADCKTRIEKIELAISTAKRAEAAEAREVKLVEAVRPFVVCPCCEGRDSCSESCTYRNDDPYGWGRLTALRSALASVKEE